MGASTAAWPAGRELSTGQAIEFLVWAELITQSRGDIHLFLPVLDRGLDAMVHRRSTGEWRGVQVKGRSTLEGAEFEIVVREASLADAQAVIVGVLLGGRSLADPVLVISVADFRRLADRAQSGGETYLRASFVPGGERLSRWSDYLYPLDELAAAVLSPAPEPTSSSAEPDAETLLEELPSDSARQRGLTGELEVLRRLAEHGGFDLYRPFPDLAGIDIAIARHGQAGVLGLQVKVVEVHSRGRRRGVVQIDRPLPGDGDVYLIVLGLTPEEGGWTDNALMMPATAVPNREFDWTPGQPGSALQAWEIRLDSIPNALEKAMPVLSMLNRRSD